MKNAVILTLERTSRRRTLSGGGLRVLGLRWLLEQLGYQVICLQPNKDSDLEPWERSFCIEHIRSDGFIQHNMNEVLRNLSCDLLVVEQWGLLDELQRPDCPVLVDLHGSLVFENQVRGYENPQQMRTKILSLSKCDAILTPGHRQKYYYLAWAKMAGVFSELNSVLQVPLFLPPDFYIECDSLNREDIVVMGGALWPWADLKFSNSLNTYFERQGFEVRTKLYEPITRELHPPSSNVSKGSFPPNLISSPEAHENLIQHYAKSSLAWDFYPDSWERKLAITTRTVEYLYCGLAPIYCNGLELSELMKRLEIGICIDSPHDLLEINNLRDRAEVCRQNILDRFPACWELEQCLEELQKLIESIPESRVAHESLIVDLEKDYRQLRCEVGEARAERDHLKGELLKVKQELRESRLTKERWKRLWMRDY